MSAKDKAKELIDKYYKLAESIEWTDKQTSEKAEKFNDELGTDVLKYWNELSKQSALIAVDEIINNWINNFKKLKEDETIEIKHSLNEMMALSHSMKYWKEVKQEIEKL